MQTKWWRRLRLPRHGSCRDRHGPSHHLRRREPQSRICCRSKPPPIDTWIAFFMPIASATSGRAACAVHWPRSIQVRTMPRNSQTRSSRSRARASTFEISEPRNTSRTNAQITATVRIIERASPPISACRATCCCFLGMTDTAVRGQVAHRIEESRERRHQRRLSQVSPARQSAGCRHGYLSADHSWPLTIGATRWRRNGMRGHPMNASVFF